MCQGGKLSCILMYVYVALPTPVGVWSMALGLHRRIEHVLCLGTAFYVLIIQYRTSRECAVFGFSCCVEGSYCIASWPLRYVWWQKSGNDGQTDQVL